ncbi:unnamed protein product [Chondrus crispus]|uniref:Glycylpeptide N-tetradecanoyltransferase n=1 Tax=Chondrus crispus TaxID=2769 RepID=R7QCL4_CHOCR|nr:unnamed protein product [Chondrus crispus]CDF35171.1 unnamed protein product [Chondrus crispus]|eukprot:XP_005714990.1 unnamed protein product [Chondrus crispus]
MAEKDTGDKPPTERKNTYKEVELSGSDARAKLAELMGTMSVAGVDGKPAEKEYKFWKTQPVPQMGQDDQLDLLGDHGQAIETKTVDQVSKKPYNLIDSFEWSDIDVTDDKQLEETYRLLNENYVEDGDAMFRFDYSREFLRWALLPPGWHPTWHVGVRVKSNKKLVAFITAVPATLRVHMDSVEVVEINFLCVHKKLRARRLAPVLIREITRRVNLQNVWQAVYTAGAVLPRPVTSSRYYHRSLNPKKLIEIGFSRLQPRMTMNRTIKLFAVKPSVSTPGIRVMRSDDVPAACKLLMGYLDQFDMHIDMTEDEFAHWLMPREGVTYSYVVEDPESHEITDMISFYSLPSSIINHPAHKTLNAAYLFFAAAAKTAIIDIMQDALVFARQNGFDVFNALDLARHSEFFKDLKFHIGDGELHYYLYNWKCRPMAKETNALVLL